MFTLVVDDFGVKYVGEEHARHSESALKEHYEVSTDWTGSLYCGINLDWNYHKRYVELHMSRYIPEVLHKYQHHVPKRAQHSPYPAPLKQYGAKIQMTHIDDTPPITKEDRTRIQQIVGSLLYYGRSVDNTLLTALSSISSAQSKGTQATYDATMQLLDYCHTHPDARVRFYASDMLLRIHSDASYLSEPEARSRAGGYFYLGNVNEDSTAQYLNGPIHIVATIIKHVMASAAEAELAALFINAKEGTVIRTTLQEMGHQQEATPIQTDNSTANKIANNTCKQQRSKAIDMRFYWIQDRIKQKQFKVFWRPGIENKADYYTKHHAPIHHQRMRPHYLSVQHESTQSRLSQSCREGVLKTGPRGAQGQTIIPPGTQGQTGKQAQPMTTVKGRLAHSLTAS